VTEFNKVQSSSGPPREFGTGAKRDSDTNKPKLAMFLRFFPAEAMERVGAHYRNGAVRYGDHNWQRGIPASECLESLCRHVEKVAKGDTSEDHLSAIVFNAAAIMYYEQRSMTEVLDLPHHKPQPISTEVST
jgi:hypothetical protein